MIRLQRHGKKHQPYYRLVVGEKRSKLLGQQTEDLGSFDPRTKESKFNKERIEYWTGVGAKLSPTAHNLLINAKIISGKKIAAHKKAKKKEGEKPAEAAAPKA